MRYRVKIIRPPKSFSQEVSQLQQGRLVDGDNLPEPPCSSLSKDDGCSRRQVLWSVKEPEPEYETETRPTMKGKKTSLERNR